MVEGDGKAWSIRDPARWEARFRTFYQIQRNRELAAKSGATPSDIQAYAEVKPESAARLRDLQTLERVQGVAAIAGFLGATTSIWRWSKTPPLVAAGGLIAPFAAAWVAEDVRRNLCVLFIVQLTVWKVTSLALGTFKYDAAQEVAHFHEWVIRRNAANN